MFWAMGNHLGPFSEASDPTEGQEQGGGGVGGQGRLQAVKLKSGSKIKKNQEPKSLALAPE